MPTINFKGKSFIRNHHLTVKYHELVPDEAASLTSQVSLNDNLIIHGDNLLALKALLPNFRKKVRCIYIDPPYNTGQENWRYNDNVNSAMMQQWLKENKPVDREDLIRHDKWLCMMMPRLYLLRELLSDDGVIFVSIGNDELRHLWMLMDEIFTEENFISVFVWKRRAPSGMAKSKVSVDHDYVLAYQNGSFEGFLGTQKDARAYSNPDNDPNGLWTLGDLTVGMTKDQRPNQYFPLVDPKTGKSYSPNPKRVWTYAPETMKQKIEMGLVVFPSVENGISVPMYKRYFKDLKSKTNPISTWIREKSEQKRVDKATNGEDGADSEENGSEGIITLYSGSNSEGTKLLQDIFEGEPFQYPKPLSLIKQLIGQVTTGDDIVLDSFAGSGTTAHAVLELNKEGGGHRQFILIEMGEYANDLTAERVRRVIKGIPHARNKKLRDPLDGSFSFFRLGKPLDIGGILSGKVMPSYSDLARYLFYNATGEHFDLSQVQEDRYYVGESSQYVVYLLYKPDLEYLKRTALTLDLAKSLLAVEGKTRLVFAPSKFLDSDYMEDQKIKFVQLPFEVFRYQV